MIEISWDKGFKKSYKKRVADNQRLKKKFWQKLEQFSSDPFFPGLRTHKLYGRLTGLWAFTVDDDRRVVFEFVGDDHALLIDIGKHDEVY
ncbi:type II toxin-antitoxin system RelE/ParE family toxin [Desulfonema magnum]|uniref:Toxin-antitoxin system, toxin component, mRNA interferase n=1 Tax=Desulfonema magnum TaxID=45655 RepID=A0A975BXD4_9BACT|nr:type II toxin-antitoxin system mRNA interferase toxin, RelE/StbE family [Desulfonema magnum]QTA93466.1 Toxin-antitoxin system, toxin component, mRNA interferase [Desulfonema magnum]